MTFSDYLLDSVLILIVFRQLRTSRLSTRAVLMPLAIVGFVARQYLRAVPTAGHDLALIAIFTGIGLAFGIGSAAFTRVWADGDRHPLVRAGWVSAGLWVLGMGFRMAFSIWASTSAGQSGLGHFSAAHQITSGAAWTDALVLMALAEVCSRVAILYMRGRMAVDGYRAPLTSVQLTTAA